MKIVTIEKGKEEIKALCEVHHSHVIAYRALGVQLKKVDRAIAHSATALWDRIHALYPESKDHVCTLDDEDMTITMGKRFRGN